MHGAVLPSPHLLRPQHKPAGLAVWLCVSPTRGHYWVWDDGKQLSFMFGSLRKAEAGWRRPPYRLEAAAVAAKGAAAAARAAGNLVASGSLVAAADPN